MKMQACRRGLALAVLPALALGCSRPPSTPSAPPAVGAATPAPPAPPAPPPSEGAAAAILAAARAASGGEAWDRVQVIESKGTIAVGGLTGTLESIEDVAHGRARVALHLGPIDSLEGFDATGGWDRAPGGEVTRRDAPEAIARSRTRAWMVRRGYLRPGSASYRDLGARDDHGRRLRGLAATPDGGAPTELWFDDAGQLARTSQQLGPFTIVTDYSDWREVGGVRLPFHAVVDRGDPRARATVTMTDIQLRPALPGTAFAPPETDADRLRFTGGAQSSELGFDLINNHILVHASIDGQPVRLLVDTGGANLVTSATAARLGLAARGEIAVTVPGKRDPSAGFAHGKTLQIGDLALANPVFLVVDTALPDVEGEDLDGLVGYELFSRVAVRIDYPQRRLTLTAPSAFAPPAGATAVPFDIANHVPVVRGSIDGVAGRFWVDTGSRLSLSTMGKFTRDHDLIGKYRPRFETVTGWGVGGPSRSRPVRFHEVAIGGATVHEVVGDLLDADNRLSDPDAAGNLGAGILRRFVVTFDYAHRTMYLEPGAAGDAREIYDRSGLFLIRVDGGRALRVAGVTPGGPAERAGVRADDRIVAIDGAAVDTRRLWQWRAYLREQAPGTRVVLRTQRGGAPARDVAIALTELVP
ncbi:MAG TPA: aspartyl protease family protein [Kofleriaceae bacterium]|jgi:predicted aspartyl protease|nr:aspartyl protease family protein [Kofleriaceae bacterium]